MESIVPSKFIVYFLQKAYLYVKQDGKSRYCQAVNIK